VTPETRTNFFVLTGASGSGKSSIIAALGARGYLCVEEIGRQVVRDEVAAGSDATPWQNREKFMGRVLARSVEAFGAITERASPVFFDRSIPECIGSALVAGVAPAEHRLRATREYRYNRTVFVTSPWPEIYEVDAERRHSFQEGVEYHRAELMAYRACGYELLAVPRAPVEARVEFILERVRAGASGTSGVGLLP